MRKIFTSFFILMHLLSIKCLGFVVSISLVWNYNQSHNIQEGSIVQVIAYNSSSANPPIANAEDSFDETGIGIYNPYSTPEGHDIVYESSFYRQGNTYRVVELFDIIGSYDRVYIRIFSATGFDEDVTLSYWGLGNVVSVRSNKTTSVSMSYNQMSQQNSFRTPYFEVIPEPPPLILIALAIPFILRRAIRI